LSVLARASGRTEMSSAVLRELQSSLEMVRAGVVPLESGVLPFAASADACSDHLQVTMVVREGRVEGLFEVLLRAECHHGTERVAHTLETQVWRP